MYDEIEPALSGQKVALFGSYDWNDGEWMELWEQRADEAGPVSYTHLARLLGTRIRPRSEHHDRRQIELRKRLSSQPIWESARYSE